MIIRYFIFPSIDDADACSQQVYRLGRPYSVAPNDVGARVFKSIQLLDGRGALEIDLDHQVLIHKAGIVYSDPLHAGTVGVLLKNFAGQPLPEELASWQQLVTTLASLPDRGDPALQGQEPVIPVRLGDTLPASAAAGLLTYDELVAQGLITAPGEPEV